MTEDLDVRRKRAAYRAAHRGTKEMDALLGRYAAAHLQTMAERDLDRLEKLIQIADPTLEAWILGKSPVDQNDFEILIRDIRSFHGLEQTGRENTGSRTESDSERS